MPPEFKPFNYREPLKLWLRSCPLFDPNWSFDFLNPYPIVGDIKTESFDSYDYAPSLMLMYTGAGKSNPRKDVIGETQFIKQANYSLFLRYSLSDEFVREKLQDTISNFEDWVDFQYFTGQTPRFGDDPENSRISATNFMLLGRTESDITVADYAAQLHVEYTKIYKREGF